MGDKDFQALVKKVVCEYANAHLDVSDVIQISEDDVFIVWQVKVLQNNKALASTTLKDGMYYELTYDGDKKRCYVDAYKKWENFCVNGAGERKRAMRSRPARTANTSSLTVPPVAVNAS